MFSGPFRPYSERTTQVEYMKLEYLIQDLKLYTHTTFLDTLLLQKGKIIGDFHAGTMH